ncbi:MAG: YfhO family protein, partial [Limisphaerales bacterium]
KKGSVYTERQKRMVRFWLVTAIICLLLAWGRHAPFYKLIYALPFFSTIRNPIKFMHMFHLALIIMFGFGLAGLWARYISGASVKPGNVFEKFKLWLKNAGGSERLYFWGLIAFVAISVLGAMVYATSRKDIENHLLKEGFSDSQIASQIANFSINEVGLYLMFLVISVVAIVLIMSGFFAGQRSKAAGLLLGAILVFDLCRANAPWIIYYDYKEKYATNPVIDYLRQKPWESRVTFDVRIAGLNLLNATGSSLPQQIAQLEQTFAMLYYQEWLQHHFLYYNIQTANYPQMPRMPKDYETMLKTFSTLPLLPRYWQLMNTKYLVGLTMFADLLNNHLDPAEKRFKVIMPFDLEPKPGVERATRLEELTAAPKTNGLFALIEWQAALPRAALYTHWISATNEQEVLQNLTDLNFDLSKTVVVLTNLPAPASAPVKATPVEIKSYSPKRITFEVENKTPSVLLLNDRYAPDWKVWVDGKQSTIFRANYLMRGIFLEPGKHEIVFRFLPSPLSLFVSLSAIGLGIFIGIYLLITHKSAPPNNAKQ